MCSLPAWPARPPTPPQAPPPRSSTRRRTTRSRRATSRPRKALVGVWSPLNTQEFLTEATYDNMRNFARGYGDDNPLYTSAGYGETTRWGSQIGAPMMPIAMNRPLFGDPPEVKLRRPSFRGIHVFVSGSSWDWFRPINAGDQLFSFGGTETIVEKDSEFAERSMQLTKTMVRFNQRAEIVAISRTLLIHTERKTARERGKYDEIEPATYTDDDIAEIDAIYAAEQARGSEPRWFEDVTVGDALHPDGQGTADDDRHDRVPRRRLRLHPVRADDEPGRLREPPAHRPVLREERVRRARCGPAGALGLGVGAGDRQPDGVRLRGDARLLAVALRHRLDGRRRVARARSRARSASSTTSATPTSSPARSSASGWRTAAASSTSRCVARTSAARSPARAPPRWRCRAASTVRSCCRRHRPSTPSRRPRCCVATGRSCATKAAGELA